MIKSCSTTNTAVSSFANDLNTSALCNWNDDSTGCSASKLPTGPQGNLGMALHGESHLPYNVISPYKKAPMPVADQDTYGVGYNGSSPPDTLLYNYPSAPM